MIIGRFTTWVIKEIIKRAEEEWYSPQVIQQELENLQSRFEKLEITEQEYYEQEQLLFERLLESRERRLEE